MIRQKKPRNVKRESNFAAGGKATQRKQKQETVNERKKEQPWAMRADGAT